MLRTLFPILDRHAGRVLAVVAVITGLLVVPFLAMAPTESASTEPAGDVFTARDRIDETFVSSIHVGFFVIEHQGGDLLRAEPMRELRRVGEALRADPELGPTLFRYYDVETESEVEGLLGLAELVAAELEAGGGSLATATDQEVKTAGAVVIDRLGSESDALGLSVQSGRDADGDWIVPAVTVSVLSDNDVLGFGNSSVNLGGSTEVEEYDRSVQDVLRTADGFQVNGVAIDVNLTSQEQGAVAGPFIGFTILAVLLIVGLTFRSYWVLATVSVALVLLIIWLKGITHLLGLKDDLVLSLIVPIAMVSFGVDFAFHSIGRYREERAGGQPSSVAFGTGMAAVSGALLLALTSDVAAFLSNLTSGIESIIQFGVGAAIALLAAYVLLGIVSPLVVARIEASVPPPSDGTRSAVVRVAGGVGVASSAMTSVLFLVFVLPWVGVVLAVVTALLGLALPMALRRRDSGAGVALGDLPTAHAGSGFARPLAQVMARVASQPVPVVVAATILTAIAGSFAVRVPAEFDVNDFFAADTDFVVSLDQLDAHVGERGGERAILYVEGPLTDPARLALLEARVDDVRGVETAVLARTDDGVTIEGGILSVFEAAWASPIMPGLVLEQAGVELTDDDRDGLPDSRQQVEALLAVAARTGVPLDADRLLLTPDEVNTAVALLEDGTVRTSFEIALVDSRSQESVAEARAVLEPIADELSADLGGSFVQLTGSPFVREASLAATNDALQTSLPVALVLCAVVATVFLRSLRYGLASIVPIVMVVAWLYAFMELAGFSINLVTATIAAVSVGIGIDFAIHFIARYREELERCGDRAMAVRVAGEGTGSALVASAVSSAVGFGILAFAPMPLFAAYGLLTALMIGLALVATLLVLPSVLVLITCDDSARRSAHLLSLPPERREDEPDATEDADRTPELGAPSFVQLVGEGVAERHRGQERGGHLDPRVVADEADRFGAVGNGGRDGQQPDRPGIERGRPWRPAGQRENGDGDAERIERSAASADVT